jgi:hypothetical protein
MYKGLFGRYPYDKFALVENCWETGYGMPSFTLLGEQRRLGALHRRDILERVADFVTPENDFPLTLFRSRSDAVTEAIGCGKSAIVWNMLREPGIPPPGKLGHRHRLRIGPLSRRCGGSGPQATALRQLLVAGLPGRCAG